MTLSKVLFSSESREWQTPPDYFRELNWFYQFDTDLCASHNNHLCDNYYFNALKLVNGRAQYERRQRSLFDEIDFYRKRCFMNPPYGQPENPCAKNCTKDKCVKRGWHTDVYIPGIGDFVQFVSEGIMGNYQDCAFAVALLPVRCDTQWWQKYIKNNPRAHVDEIPGRLKFRINGKVTGPAPFPSATVLFK